ncbi:hypothetical protein ACQ4PT_049578 [Festuca glaucescens]
MLRNIITARTRPHLPPHSSPRTAPTDPPTPHLQSPTHTSLPLPKNSLHPDRSRQIASSTSHGCNPTRLPPPDRQPWLQSDAPRPDFASHPSDLELINTYLIPWVNTGERPWNFINVYAAKPRDLATNFAPATASDGLEGWYFFSTLRSKNRRGQRKSRTVDDGCWHSECAAKPLFAGISHTRQISYRQTFSFATKGKGDGRLLRSGWLMAEIGLNSDGSEDDELVLCKVYRSPRVKRSMAAEAAGPRARRGAQWPGSTARTTSRPLASSRNHLKGSVAQIEEETVRATARI